MTDSFGFDGVGDDEIRRERAIARDLRKSRWWQRKTASGLCHYCSKKMVHKDITMDHLVPLGRGGKSSKDNLVPSCKDCNNKKKNMLVLEWEEYLETLKKSQ